MGHGGLTYSFCVKEDFGTLVLPLTTIRKGDGHLVSEIVADGW